MPKTYKKIIFSLVALLLHCSIFAQDKPTTVGMADGMRSEGRIYVVVAVMLTILFGIVFYLIRLDKRLNHLEKSK